MTTLTAASTPTQTITCPHCGRDIAATGKDIHYCVQYIQVGPRRARICHEYVGCYDGREIGAGYATNHDAEIALDGYALDQISEGLTLSATALDGVCQCGETCGPARHPAPPADDHNLITPDEAECPSTSDPQPVEDLPGLAACLAYSRPPSLNPLPASWPERPNLYIVTNGQEYAFWNRGAWSSDDEFSGKCLLVEDNARHALDELNRCRLGDDPEWHAIILTMEAGPIVDL